MGNAEKMQIDRFAHICDVRRRRMANRVLELQTDGDGRMGPSSSHRDDKF